MMGASHYLYVFPKHIVSLNVNLLLNYGYIYKNHTFKLCITIILTKENYYYY